jgi:hypothetical protein
VEFLNSVVQISHSLGPECRQLLTSTPRLGLHRGHDVEETSSENHRSDTGTRRPFLGPSLPDALYEASGSSSALRFRQLCRCSDAVSRKSFRRICGVDTTTESWIFRLINRAHAKLMEYTAMRDSLADGRSYGDAWKVNCCAICRLGVRSEILQYCKPLQRTRRM